MSRSNTHSALARDGSRAVYRVAANDCSCPQEILRSADHKHSQFSLGDPSPTGAPRYSLPGAKVLFAPPCDAKHVRHVQTRAAEPARSRIVLIRFCTLQPRSFTGKTRINALRRRERGRGFDTSLKTSSKPTRVPMRWPVICQSSRRLGRPALALAMCGETSEAAKLAGERRDSLPKQR
jgi:hypothetical protein